MEKHKVFISYYHGEDQKYKEYLIRMNRSADLFNDMSVREGDIDDTNMSHETIRKTIRDEYIKDATVLILLCGKNTKGRKHVDWEINAAMFDTEKNPQMGILIINLPGSGNAIRRADVADGKLITKISDNIEWYNITTREEYVRNYPDMPDRIIDNFLVSDVYITVVNWATIENNPELLKNLIHNAYCKKRNQNYTTSKRPMKTNNSPLIS